MLIWTQIVTLCEASPALHGSLVRVAGSHRLMVIAESYFAAEGLALKPGRSTFHSERRTLGLTETIAPLVRRLQAHESLRETRSQRRSRYARAVSLPASCRKAQRYPTGILSHFPS